MRFEDFFAEVYRRLRNVRQFCRGTASPVDGQRVMDGAALSRQLKPLPTPEDEPGRVPLSVEDRRQDRIVLGTAAVVIRDPGGLVVALVAAVLVVLGLEGRLVVVEPFGRVPFAACDLLEVAVDRMLEDDAGVSACFGAPLDGLD